jgi:hypothetical protein
VHSDGRPQVKAYRKADLVPTRAGLYSVRFHLEKNDPVINNGTRCELSAGSEPVNVERWYGFSIYPTRSWWGYDQAPEIVTQWHQSYPITSPRFQGSPPLAIVTRAGNWEISARKRSWDNTVDQDTVVLWRGPYERGRWTDWVVHVKWSPRSDGLLEIWKVDSSGRQKLTLRDSSGDRSHGPNKFNDGKGNYMKCGIYKWPWSQNRPSDTTKRVMYYDELRIADERGSYNAVAPGAGTAAAGSLRKP